MPTRTGSANGARGPASPRPAVSWRRVLWGAAWAGVTAVLLLLLGEVHPALVYGGCLSFGAIGMWIGWGSGRPWVDGALYGSLSWLLVAAVFAFASSLGWVGTLAALFLVLPQGVLGVWLGARLRGWRAGTARGKDG